MRTGRLASALMRAIGEVCRDGRPHRASVVDNESGAKFCRCGFRIHDSREDMEASIAALRSDTVKV